MVTWKYRVPCKHTMEDLTYFRGLGGLLEEVILKWKVKTKTEHAQLCLGKIHWWRMTKINKYREWILFYKCPSNSVEATLFKEVCCWWKMLHKPMPELGYLRWPGNILQCLPPLMNHSPYIWIQHFNPEVLLELHVEMYLHLDFEVITK